MDPVAQQWLGEMLTTYLASWVPEVFGAQGLELETTTPKTQYSVAGIVGFVGELSGTLLVGAESELLRASHPARNRAPIVTNRMQLDWAGELANLIIGRLKLRLKKHGIDFDFSPPISLTGERLQHLVNGNHSHQLAFHCEYGEVGVWVDAEMDETATMHPEFFSEIVLGAGPEGSIVLF
jgi:CheY-specific phosphatase CheX